MSLSCQQRSGRARRALSRLVRRRADAAGRLVGWRWRQRQRVVLARRAHGALVAHDVAGAQRQAPAVLRSAVGEQRGDADARRGAALDGRRRLCCGGQALFDRGRGGGLRAGTVGERRVAADVDALAAGDAPGDAGARRVAVAEGWYRADGVALAQGDVRHRAVVRGQATTDGNSRSNGGQAGADVHHRRGAHAAATAEAHGFGLGRRRDIAALAQWQGEAGAVTALPRQA